MNDVAVLIPYYNNLQGLVASVSSITRNERVDLIIVDDGSKTEPIDEVLIKSRFLADGVITFLSLKENKGIEYALNLGLDYILSKNYKYTARLDCGDLCVGGRFEKQLNFLNSNPHVKLLGTAVKAVSTEGLPLYTIKLPEKHSQIKDRMYLNAMFIHPTVMFKTSIIGDIGKYPINYKAAEDYAFFFKIVKKFETANLRDILVIIEINAKGISKTKRKIQVLNRIKIIKRHFYFGFWPVYGLLRNYLLLVLPYSTIERIKILLK